ncbi:carbohydrate porin [Aestuariibacter sp. GS-14]|uniref:carbohydrate porin n=1 Tax=Aestuariibacter sp. GS-14 TaxID=2590670 RepID=UPI00112AB92E|nr:carbohydrate porin [Aestuariibacter sp. GS-14]TPV58966.1 carbohydrate porin [Aestuariibacter sp. GS-14]
MSLLRIIYLFLLPVLGLFTTTNSIASDQAASWDFGVNYTAELMHNARGGQETGSTYMDIAELNFTRSSDNGQWYGYLFYTNNNSFSADKVGDTQIVSNIDSEQMLRVMELWYETEISFGINLKAGLYDLNSEFDAIEPAGLFLNSSHGIGPDYSQTGDMGPSIFPFSALAIRIASDLGAGWSLQGAVIDAVAGDPEHPKRTDLTLSAEDGALLAVEANYNNNNWRFGIGGWHYTQPTEVLSAERLEHNHGIYALVSNQYQLNDSEAKLNSFVRFGVTDSHVNALGSYWGMGVTLSNFSSRRPDDQLGIAIANARTSTYGQIYDGLSATSETNIEMTYQATIGEQIILQPDIQYIINPGNLKQRENALVFGLRAQFTFL